MIPFEIEKKRFNVHYKLIETIYQNLKILSYQCEKKGINEYSEEYIFDLKNQVEIYKNLIDDLVEYCYKGCEIYKENYNYIRDFENYINFPELSKKIHQAKQEIIRIKENIQDNENLIKSYKLESHIKENTRFAQNPETEHVFYTAKKIIPILSDKIDKIDIKDPFTNLEKIEKQKIDLKIVENNLNRYLEKKELKNTELEMNLKKLKEKTKGKLETLELFIKKLIEEKKGLNSIKKNLINVYQKEKQNDKNLICKENTVKIINIPLNITPKENEEKLENMILNFSKKLNEIDENIVYTSSNEIEKQKFRLKIIENNLNRYLEKKELKNTEIEKISYFNQKKYIHKNNFLPNYQVLLNL